MKHIAIIGAGASGLFLAKQCSGDDRLQVFVFEKSKNVGTKLRASGGGKANIFNDNITPEGYNHPDFARHLLQKVTPDILRQEFERMGLRMITDEEGRVYPMSQFSRTVVDILCDNLAPNVHLETEHEVKRVAQKDGFWHVDDCPVPFDHIVFASGTTANMILQNRKHYNAYLDSLGLKINNLQPSLVGFKIKDYPKILSGCRVHVIASLYHGDTLVHREPGEVTFKDDGISGIVILNLSAYYNRLDDKQNCSIELNFLYQDEDYDVNQHLAKYHSLKGLLHPQLNDLYEQRPFDVKKFRLEIDEPYDLAFAQVCHGGIDIAEVDDHFALKRCPGIYVMGEMLDMDGVCGGYNLFFAFASALIVFENL